MLIAYATSITVLIISLLFATALVIAQREYALRSHVMMWTGSFAMLAISHAFRIGVLDASASGAALAYFARMALIVSVGLMATGFCKRSDMQITWVVLIVTGAILAVLGSWIVGSTTALAIGRLMTASAVLVMIVGILRSLPGRDGMTLIIRSVAGLYGLYMTLMAFAVLVIWAGGIDDAAFNTLTLIGMPIVTVVAGLLVLLVLLSDLAGALRDQALLDPLTQVLNRRGMVECLSKMRMPSDVGLAVIAADLDKFKAINDQYGHAAGDHVLVSFAAYLKSAATDFRVARVGGEEFLLFAVGMPPDKAARRAEEIRAGLPRMELTLHGIGNITASFGVASGSCADEWTAVAEQADHALYQAKRAGRDRVVLLDTLHPNKAA